MKKCYIAVQRLSQGETVFKDAEGAFYYTEHGHPVLKGKEFTSPTHLLQCVIDYQNQIRSGELQEKSIPFGEIIIQEVLTF
jgi:hypothetical protein